MTQPTAHLGHVPAPAPGAVAPELRLVRLRRHARRLFWSALVLIAVSALVGYYSGNLPRAVTEIVPFADIVMWALAGLVVLLLVVLPYLRWLGHTYTITTRRVVEQSGMLRRQRREVAHARGYAVTLRLGPVQRMWGTGTLLLDPGGEPPLRIVDVPSVTLVHETLVDQVEVGQILAHRDAHATSVLPDNR
ncbi:PH domain-containing protein [Microbacterium sp. No. 7]|uniref:PH domain-containing protein n=1 Tax=Microbacterium sp. No. 7 TaxID=1714373 RepID=UPI0006D21AA5|nr:PH domain-containing protein [Microbacterium sp. No. 7]ALJ19369.1 hypothetical protein AOA12_05400 [Microbacterium sp. No. 7]